MIWDLISEIWDYLIFDIWDLRLFEIWDDLRFEIWDYLRFEIVMCLICVCNVSAMCLPCVCKNKAWHNESSVQYFLKSVIWSPKNVLKLNPTQASSVSYFLNTILLFRASWRLDSFHVTAKMSFIWSRLLICLCFLN